MKEDNVVRYENPGVALPVADVLTEVLRGAAQELLRAAVTAEVTAYLAAHEHLKEGARQRVVRNGYLPERQIQTGIGPVPVKAPRVRDRAGELKFESKILPAYLRRTRSMEELLPWLYLKGLSSGDFRVALTALVGQAAPGLSAATISRLKEIWRLQYEAWRQRDLAHKEYVYIWVDGIHFGVRLEDARQCMLVIMGATADGKKELLALSDGYRESAESWKELLLDLKERGLPMDPKLAVGDGALGFWKALPQVFGETRPQRCWVHKTRNVLDKLPQSQQGKAKASLQDIWNSSTRAEAEAAFDKFISNYEPKYPKAATCLAQDREVLLTFYDFPAPHWQHLRTTNPIESTFATVRLRTAKTRGCVGRGGMLAIFCKLVKSAEKGWRKLRGHTELPKLIVGIVFKDGEEQQANTRIAA